MSRYLAALVVFVAACANDGGTTATTLSPGTTSAAAVAVQPDQPPAAYFLFGSGEPHLVPVAHDVSSERPLVEALTALVSGPTDPALVTAIPSGTELNDVAVVDGVATIDLSSEFETGANALGARAGLAQVVYTATRFPTVDAVRFLIDGNAVKSFGGEGIPFVEPLVRPQFQDLQPSIFIDDPPYGGALADLVSGESMPGEFQLSVTNHAGLVIADVKVPGSADGWRPFSTRVPYIVAQDELGTLVASTIGADFNQTDVVTYPLTLRRPDSVEGLCSGGALAPEAVSQDLPAPVAATRSAIITAAASCDFDDLAAIAGSAEFFSFDFGGNSDPELFWTQAESLGEPFTARLIELLNGPFVIDEFSDPTLYVWPSAYRLQPSEEDWAALEGIYDTFDIQNFRELEDYLGLRVGINAEGVWQFAVSGD
jgi:hypothetical protein